MATFLRTSAKHARATALGAKHVVVVGVDGDSASADALDWAAAEASASGADLRIVYAYGTTWLTDPLLAAADLGLDALPVGSELLAAAADRVRAEAPHVRVETAMVPGTPALALLHAAPKKSLVVVGHSPNMRSRVSTARNVLRRTKGPVAVVRLRDADVPGPSSARVVVVDLGGRRSEAAVERAFAEARRRRVNMTRLMLLAPPGGVELDRSVQPFPEITVRERVIREHFAQDIVEASRGAALLVLPGACRPLRALRSSVPKWALEVTRTASSPVLFVPNQRRDGT